ncbi:XRE family transcriptional regulator [Brevibacterium sanguinis]|uniref:XRE family transcriptional regulator n=3 Tax=Brevibacteriaceae TaxID=85019 RepID=A0A366IHB0_9MICO|nr:XRE family transcriptional regulator [Brevibacterium sanguinis]RBP69505.1 XRE family transcriptional regulator [Brevibacterium celere]
MTLKDVAEEAGITTGYLSQLERGIAMGSVATLQSVCSVIRLNVGELFNEPNVERSPVLRYADAARKRFGNGASKIKISPSHFDHLEVLLGQFEPGGDTGVKPYTHGASEEILLVIEGEVEVTVNGTTNRLKEMDSFHYKSDQPHRVAEATGTRIARVVWMMAPPTY